MMMGFIPVMWYHDGMRKDAERMRLLTSEARAMAEDGRLSDILGERTSDSVPVIFTLGDGAIDRIMDTLDNREYSIIIALTRGDSCMEAVRMDRVHDVDMDSLERMNPMTTMERLLRHIGTSSIMSYHGTAWSLTYNGRCGVMDDGD